MLANSKIDLDAFDLQTSLGDHIWLIKNIYEA